MQAGKLSLASLQQLIFDRVGRRRPEVVLGGALGEDSAALNLAADLCVVSTDPITGAVKNAGWLAVHVSCNDVAANGAEPVAVLLTLLLPVGSRPDLVAEIINDAERAAREVQVEIVGGHTEFTAAVNQAVISTTVIGRVAADQLATSSQICAGDALVATKYMGLEGTSILAWDFPAEVEPILGANLLMEARGLSQHISVVPEAKIAVACGVRAMHDATEGGVLGAAFELAAAANLGFELVEDQFIVHPATQLLAASLQFDPLRLISSGTLLLATSQPEDVLRQLQQAGIPASVVGRFTQGRDCWLMRSDGNKELIGPPESDELWRLQRQLSPKGDR